LMEQDTGLNEAVVSYLRSVLGADQSTLLEQVASALQVESDVTSGANLVDLWKNRTTTTASTSTSTTTTTTEASAPVDAKAEEKFEQYKTLLVKRGYFSNVEEGSEAYNDRLNKARERFFAKSKATEPAAQPVAATPVNDPHAGMSTEERVRKGDELKLKANELLNKRLWEESITVYTEAIEYHPNNAIYYANRSIAYQKIGKINEAMEDAKKAIKIDANYSKSYARLADCYLSKKDYTAAIQAYKDGLAVDPSNAALKSGLEKAQTLKASQTTGAPASGGLGGMGGALGGGMPGMPGMEGMAEMFRNMGGTGGAEGPGGGMADYMQQMMTNPDFMQAATQFMMENPQMMEWAQQVSQDPSVLQQLMSGQMPAGMPMPTNIPESFANMMPGGKKGGE